MLGASCFAIASALCLVPSLAGGLGLSEKVVNSILFIGSIPFTTAAYLQLDQAANAPEFGASAQTRHRRAVIGWRPRDIGWMSCGLQFLGTLLFNVSTFDALLPSLGWAGEEVLIWVPNVLGSILFTLVGAIGFFVGSFLMWPEITSAVESESRRGAVARH